MKKTDSFCANSTLINGTVAALCTCSYYITQLQSTERFLRVIFAHVKQTIVVFFQLMSLIITHSSQLSTHYLVTCLPVS